MVEDCFGASRYRENWYRRQNFEETRTIELEEFDLIKTIRI